MTTMREWVEAYARATGQPAPDGDTIDQILELAGTAAHTSLRQAAPITCWLAATAGLTPDEARIRAELVAADLDGSP